MYMWTQNYAHQKKLIQRNNPNDTYMFTRTVSYKESNHSLPPWILLSVVLLLFSPPRDLFVAQGHARPKCHPPILHLKNSSANPAFHDAPSYFCLSLSITEAKEAIAHSGQTWIISSDCSYFFSTILFRGELLFIFALLQRANCNDCLIR